MIIAAANELTGPILCLVGPARVGEDLARQVDREGDRPRLRSFLARRRARMRRRSAATGVPISAPCRARSSSRCAGSTRSQFEVISHQQYNSADIGDERGHDGQPADEFRDQAVFQEVLRLDLTENFAVPRSSGAMTLALKPIEPEPRRAPR